MRADEDQGMRAHPMPWVGSCIVLGCSLPHQGWVLAIILESAEEHAVVRYVVEEASQEDEETEALASDQLYDFVALFHQFRGMLNSFGP